MLFCYLSIKYVCMYVFPKFSYQHQEQIQICWPNLSVEYKN